MVDKNFGFFQNRYHKNLNSNPTTLSCTNWQKKNEKRNKLLIKLKLFVQKNISPYVISLKYVQINNLFLILFQSF